MREVAIAVVQYACGAGAGGGADRAEALVRKAAAAGGQVILLPELFAGPYFCQTEDPRHFALALPFAGHPLVARFAALARELGVVLPVSFFEQAGPAHFNSVAIVDADGRILGRYRKSHIPQGPGYAEKYYFSPGDTGLAVWETAFGRVGVGICWDQWFPEAARAMALAGAEMLLYPTAIGSEPAAPGHDSRPHWEAAMRGHAAANILPVAAANRIGAEDQDGQRLTFYGSSFIADATGELVAQAGRTDEEVCLARLDLAAIADFRRSWGVFRDRRPDLYGRLAGYGG